MKAELVVTSKQKKEDYAGRKKFFGHTWLGWLNIIVLQWFCIRLAQSIDMTTQDRKWFILKWIVPTTGWNSDYKFIGNNPLE